MSEVRRTPAETLMTALEDIEDCEEVMIIRVNGDDVTWSTTTDRLYKKIGMLRFVLTVLESDIARVREE
jgi:hypothetical protein